MADQSVRCQPAGSVVEPGFWSVFAKRKLELFKLKDDAVQLRGWLAAARASGMAPQLRVGAGDLLTGGEAQPEAPPLAVPAHGRLLNSNTLEEFKKRDKRALLEGELAALRAQVAAGEADEDPSLLARFLVLSYADLKRHKFVYWFAFPAEGGTGDTLESVGPASELLDLTAESWASLLAPPLRGFGALLDDGSEVTLAAARAAGRQRVRCLVMLDPSGTELPGWPLRNLLLWARERLGAGPLQVLCLRRDAASSLLIRVAVAPPAAEAAEAAGANGWEPNAAGKMGPRLTDLSAQLDPEKLAQAACDLNLKLMRWRALPELDTDMLARTKCLLVGSGTLGCAVARCLLGWGFRQLTMLDNGKVSYSNPVRQSLYQFEDCVGEGRPKAEAAAAALRRIHPGLTVEGVQLSVPMPGHMASTASEVEAARGEATRLEALVESHDVIILLTDTRESRWLPTLLAAKHDKPLLNAALGFDTFMVMRHGAATETESTSPRLGCYFCNDVVAPQNSLRDRTLDQQCTVTRPGLAPIAGAMLVELLVGLLHHPQRHHAGLVQPGEAEEAALLGQLPHQLRGSLHSFGVNAVSGQAFPQCTACSPTVVAAHRDRGHDLLLEAMNKPTSLEDLTGLTALRESSAVDDLLLEGGFGDSDSDDF